ncbi:MAG: YraN family protein [Clostridia bacterium]
MVKNVNEYIMIQYYKREKKGCIPEGWEMQGKTYGEIPEIKGYMIIKRNYRCRSGEIDIIVRRGNEIGFCGGKSRLDAGCVRREVETKKRKRGS